MTQNLRRAFFCFQHNQLWQRGNHSVIFYWALSNSSSLSLSVGLLLSNCLICTNHNHQPHDVSQFTWSWPQHPAVHQTIFTEELGYQCISVTSSDNNKVGNEWWIKTVTRLRVIISSFYTIFVCHLIWPCHRSKDNRFNLFYKTKSLANFKLARTSLCFRKDYILVFQQKWLPTAHTTTDIIDYWQCLHSSGLSIFPAWRQVNSK